jgi:hypothetical protein
MPQRSRKVFLDPGNWPSPAASRRRERAFGAATAASSPVPAGTPARRHRRAAEGRHGEDRADDHQHAMQKEFHSWRAVRKKRTGSTMAERITGNRDAGVRLVAGDLRRHLAFPRSQDRKIARCSSAVRGSPARAARLISSPGPPPVNRRERRADPMEVVCRRLAVASSG